MSFVNYLIIFVIVYIIIFISYYFMVVGPQLRALRNKEKKKRKKEKKYPNELILLTSYYKIDINKIGVIRMLRILNVINPLIMSVLVMVVIPIKESWLKILVLTLLMIPTIWFSYYFLAKYLKHLERKSDEYV